MTSKSCRKCGDTRPVEDFGRHPQMADGHLNHCKACVSSRQKQLYAVQRSSRIARARAHYHAHRETILANSREKWHADPDYRAKRLRGMKGRVFDERQRERQRVSRAVHAERHKNYDRTARARRFGVPDGLTLGEWQAMLGAVHGCAYCGSHDRIGVDHVVPLSRGGSHELGNVVPCCLRCNASKFTLTLIEWLTSHRKRAAIALAYLTNVRHETVVLVA